MGGCHSLAERQLVQKAKPRAVSWRWELQLMFGSNPSEDAPAAGARGST